MWSEKQFMRLADLVAASNLGIARTVGMRLTSSKSSLLGHLFNNVPQTRFCGGHVGKFNHEHECHAGMSEKRRGKCRVKAALNPEWALRRLFVMDVCTSSGTLL